MTESVHACDPHCEHALPIAFGLLADGRRTTRCRLSTFSIPDIRVNTNVNPPLFGAATFKCLHILANRPLIRAHKGASGGNCVA